ncbi:PucR family transcriptional regulator [Spirillospora sp. NPDC048823]|uniref:PucR family transcriptional regulator n=1 Tax=unclassified Spirillospora TaxID=2642701 RepID=UPI00371791C3
MDLNVPVHASVANAIAALDPRIGDITGEIVANILDENPPLREDLDLVDLLSASVEANVTTAVHVIGHGIPIEQVEAPPAAAEYARRLAQRDIPIRLLIRAYRLGQAVFTRWCYNELVAHVTDRDTALAAGQALNESAFAYIDQVTEYVVTTYIREREQWLRYADAARAEQVRSLLEGGTEVDVRAAEAALGHPLHGTHLGLVAWVGEADPGGEGGSLARVELVVRRVAERLAACGRPLVIPRDESSARAWLPLRSPVRLDPEAFGDVLAGRGRGIRLAVGDPSPGVAGFRRTIREAERARTVAVAAGSTGRPVTLFGRIAPVALMAADLTGTREWVVGTLGPLAADDDQNARLRETLYVFLASRGSYLETAKRLTLHKNTVLYRVHKAEEVRGRPVGDDRLEVELALFACRWLGPSVLCAPAPSGGTPHRR